MKPLALGEGNEVSVQDVAKLGIGLLGCGVVGQGVVRLVAKHPTLRLVAVAVRDAGRDRGLDPSLITTDPHQVVDHPEVRIVVEVMGGLEPARTLVLRALGQGKHVVTANKALLAHHGREILEAARAHGVEVYFEAAVGGGIPVIMPLKRGLAANAIQRVSGIINGTTNYILTRMAQDGDTFGAALGEAQRLGYAEADPTADVGGYDAAHKLAILASILSGAFVPLGAIYREGIERLTPKDLAYARELGYAVKLLGIARRVGDRLEARLHPAMIPLSHPLARIDGVTNAVTVVGDAVGEVTFSGPGAGSLPTASAVVGDVLNIAEAVTSGTPPSRLMDGLAAHEARVVPISEVETAYYLRLVTEDMPGVLGAVGSLFGGRGVSIRYFVQKEVRDGLAELVFVTHAGREQAFMEALDAIKALGALREVAALIRVEEDANGR
ncbi:homoserine dehydrogenase [bacterium]|nr:homoserine dehydrogenase [bacterium]